MSKLKLTKWYSSDQNPVRVGLYQVKNSDNKVYFSYFDGRRFNGCWFTKERALENDYFPTREMNLQWRGIAK